MLTIYLSLINAVPISALGLHFLQPILPAESNSTTAFALPNDPLAAVNASHLLNSSGIVPQQWDGTIELPLNELNTSLSFPLLNGPSHLQSDADISTYNASAGPRPKPGPGPRPAPDLPPLPRGWNIVCDGRLGTGMSPPSCLEAWTFLPPIETIVSFGPRNAENAYDVGLPKRYLSCMLRNPSLLSFACLYRLYRS